MSILYTYWRYRISDDARNIGGTECEFWKQPFIENPELIHATEKFFKTTAIILGLVLASIAIIYVGWAVFVGILFASMCENSVLKTVISPNKKQKLVVFTRNCGATTDFSTQISILDADDELPNDSGNVFVADCDHGTAPSGPGGGPAVLVSWTGEDSVKISHDPLTRVFLSESSWEGIQIEYEKSVILSDSEIPSMTDGTSSRRKEFDMGLGDLEKRISEIQNQPVGADSAELDSP